jgi:hypothetical protein
MINKSYDRVNIFIRIYKTQEDTGIVLFTTHIVNKIFVPYTNVA